ncbi:MAG: hypothetical protein ACI8P3_004517 [Saprospiraceae bacterium]
MINPKGIDTGKENFSLLNQTDQDVKLDGWYVVSKSKTKQFLNGKNIKANELMTIKAIPSLLRLEHVGNLSFGLQKSISGTSLHYF